MAAPNRPMDVSWRVIGMGDDSSVVAQLKKRVNRRLVGVLDRSPTVDRFPA